MLIRCELRKLCRAGFLPLLLLLAVGLRAVLCVIPAYHEHPYNDEVYKRYTETLFGKLTEEKTACLNDRLSEIEELLAVYDEMQQRYTRGEISLGEYSAYTSRHGIAAAEESTVRYLCRKCEALAACEGLDRQLFYDTPWQELFEDNGLDLLLLMGVICIAAVSFEREYSSGASAVLLTSGRGRGRLCTVKLCCAGVSAIVLSLMLSGARLGVFAARTGLEFSDLPAGNVLITEDLGNKSLLGYFLTDAALKALAAGMYALLCCLMSVVSRGAVFAVSLSFIALLTPLLILSGSEIPDAPYFLPAAVLRKMYLPETSPLLTALLITARGALIFAAACILWSRRRASLRSVD